MATAAVTTTKKVIPPLTKALSVPAAAAAAMNARTGNPIAQIKTRVAVRDMNEPQWKHDSQSLAVIRGGIMAKLAS
jgi:hypothetical protein